MNRSRQRKRYERSRSKKISIRRFMRVFSPCILTAILVMPAASAEEPGEKLAGGVETAATSWTEVPREMADTTEEKNAVEGVTVGAIKGAGKAVVDTTRGVVDAATFYVPDEEKKQKKSSYMDEHVSGKMNKDVDEEMADMHQIDETQY